MLQHTLIFPATLSVIVLIFLFVFLYTVAVFFFCPYGISMVTFHVSVRMQKKSQILILNLILWLWCHQDATLAIIVSAHSSMWSIDGSKTLLLQLYQICLKWRIYNSVYALIFYFLFLKNNIHELKAFATIRLLK